MTQILKFVSNQTYQVVPGGTVGGQQNTYLRIRANSIYNIMHENGSIQPAGTFIPQSTTKYGPTITPINAEGFGYWDARYYHFTVLGSRLQATYEPTGPNPNFPTARIIPSTFYVNLSGSNNQIGTSSHMDYINELPYTKRASIISTQSNVANGSGNGTTSQNRNNGVRCYMNYSTKRFEGVTDVDDNDQFKGNFLTPSGPGEGSYYTVGLQSTIPSTAAAAAETQPPGILRLKIEYIVKLTEPTNTNQVQENSSGWI
jgi:hypothetical protein